MTDFSVFWAVPILLLFVTWFFGSLSVHIRESDSKWLWPAPILFVIFAHYLNYCNRDNLRSIFHGGGQHMGYYEALMMYGSPVHQWFNWILLGLSAFYCFFLCIVCLFNIDINEKKS
jgi:hypothetical protein